MDVGGHGNSCSREKTAANAKREQWCRAIQKGWVILCMSKDHVRQLSYRFDEVYEEVLALTKSTLLSVR